RHVDAAAEILRPSLGFDLRQIVSGAVSDDAHTRLRDTRIAQPAIFAVSHALAQLVMSWGLQPAAMIGHSIGEYVAACVSGVFSFEDALRLVQARGVDVRPLQTSHAFHSPAMEPILEDFTARVRTVQGREPAIPFVSNLTG